jgi:hypothetical protein
MKVRLARSAACIRKKIMHASLFEGKSEEKRLLGRPKPRQENNINLELRDIWVVVWSGLIWLRDGSSEGLSLAKKRTFLSHTISKNSRVDTQLVTSQVEFRYICDTFTGLILHLL